MLAIKANIKLTLLALALTACTQKKADCDRKCLQEMLNNHAVRTEEFWTRIEGKHLADKVLFAPPEVIEYVKLDNRKNGYPNEPKPSNDQRFLEIVKEALAELPPSVQTKIGSKLAGILIMRDLGGSGLTDSILDGNGIPFRGFIILDSDVLQSRTANQWATWKESTPFKPDPTFSIEATIENKHRDLVKYATQYVLLHEIAHVLSVGEDIHPHWGKAPSSIQEIDRFTFFNLSWLVDREKNKYVSRFDAAVFPEGPQVVYYFGADLAASQMATTYANLEKTNFPTLYASTRPDDDWAESFVTYVHSVLLKKPFSIKIKKDGKTIKEFGLCWGTPRCAKKESFLAKYFSPDPSH